MDKEVKEDRLRELRKYCENLLKSGTHFIICQGDNHKSVNEILRFIIGQPIVENILLEENLDAQK